MKLAVSSYSLWRWCSDNGKSLEQAIDWIADAGVGAIEFAGLDAKAAANPVRRARAVRKRCEKRGLKIVSYCVAAELIQPPAAQRRQVEALKTEVDVAAELGVPSMRHDVTLGYGKLRRYNGPKTVAAALKIVVPLIREIADYGQSRGVKTSVENHGFFLQSAERVEQLLDAVNHPNFALTMDMGNFLCVNDDPVAAVKRLAKRAVMVHIKDFHVKPRKHMPAEGWFETPTSIALRGAIVGHGAIDIPAQLQHLKRVGYKGYLSLEFEGIEEPTYAIRQGLNYVKTWMKRV